MNKQEKRTTNELESFISDGTPQDVRERYASLPEIAAETDFGELDRNLVVIDTEATGVSYRHDELTQIAAARVECGVVVDRFVTFVNPGKSIPEDVVHLTDIHDEDVADAPSPSEALESLVDFVGDAKIVAHNVEFDKTFTTRHPSGYPLLENTWIDSLDLARITVPRLTSHRLLDLVRAFDAPLSTHRADADVTATCAVFRILLAGVATMPPSLVCQIAKMAAPEQWSTQAVFAYFARVYERAARRTSEESVWGEGSPDVSPLGDYVPASAFPVTLDERAKGTSALDLEFSLRDLRKARIQKLDDGEKRRSKEDAEEIARDPSRALSFPSKEEMGQAFSSTGLVGELYEDYEPRDEQRQMAQAVAGAFASSENLMVEAGTGVGKSMAYLVPSALTAQANNITVGIATKTNALLDQLVYHELPALADAMQAECPGEPRLSYAPLKGYAHYPCLRRIEGLVEDGPRMTMVAGKEQSQAPALAALLSFVEQSDYDDLDGLKMDYRAIPKRSITTSSRDCLRNKCPYFNASCFVRGSRKRAESSDIVVTNHSLLFCDLAADGGLLPPIRYWTVDEAHGAEDEARRAFSITLDAEEIISLANRVDGKDASRNVFARAERKATEPLGRKMTESGGMLAGSQAEVGAESADDSPAPLDGLTLFYALTSKARSAGASYGEAARAFVASLKDLLFFDTNKHNKNYENVEIWINDDVRGSATFRNITSLGKQMTDAAEKLASACQEIVGFLEDVEGAEQAQRDIAVVAYELKDQINAVSIILENPSEAYAYSATLSRKKDRVAEKLEALLVYVGDQLNETLYARTHSVVFTSATLTVDGSFEAIEGALGLNATEFSSSRSCKLDSSFDFDSQMTIYIVSDMPEPNTPFYLDALEDLLVAVHRAEGGRMLTLFTNRREMERCYDAVQPQLKADGLRLVCQRWGVSTKGLRDDFKKDDSLSLFALKSFWEGFDVPGAPLKGVIIPKLPFSKPTDPLSCERSLRDDQAWRHYVLPEAVLETRQAAGRLIRKADDSGVLILADRRLLTKSYGKSFLDSMPSRTIKVMSADEVAAELARRRNAGQS